MLVESPSLAATAVVTFTAASVPSRGFDVDVDVDVDDDVDARVDVDDPPVAAASSVSFPGSCVFVVVLVAAPETSARSRLLFSFSVPFSRR